MYFEALPMTAARKTKITPVEDSSRRSQSLFLSLPRQANKDPETSGFLFFWNPSRSWDSALDLDPTICDILGADLARRASLRGSDAPATRRR
jgi:hypothetical protein